MAHETGTLPWGLAKTSGTGGWLNTRKQGWAPRQSAHPGMPPSRFGAKGAGASALRWKEWPVFPLPLLSTRCRVWVKQQRSPKP